MGFIKTGSGKVQSVQEPKPGKKIVAGKEDLKDVPQKKTVDNQAPQQ